MKRVQQHSALVNTNMKQIGTLTAIALVTISIGLMLVGWTVPQRVAFEAGVVGFLLLPFAILAMLFRITLSFIPSVWLRSFADKMRISNANLKSQPSFDNMSSITQSQRQQLDYAVVFDDPMEVKDPMGSPLRKGYTNTSPMHESYISNPDGYIPDYDAVFDDDR
jgi:hypothetical protein